MSLPEEEDCHAGAIEEATDGRGRGVRRQARRALEAEPQGRFAADGGEQCYAALSALARVTFNSLSTGTGARSVLMPGQPAKAKRSTSVELFRRRVAPDVE